MENKKRNRKNKFWPKPTGLAHFSQERNLLQPMPQLGFSRLGPVGQAKIWRQKHVAVYGASRGGHRPRATSNQEQRTGIPKQLLESSPSNVPGTKTRGILLCFARKTPSEQRIRIFFDKGSLY